MPIEHKAGATILTGDSIEFFRFCQLKAAVGLELQGIRISRGPMVWTRVKREFGLTGADKQAVYSWLCGRVDGLRAQQEHQIEEDGRIKREVGGQEVS